MKLRDLFTAFTQRRDHRRQAALADYGQEILLQVTQRQNGYLLVDEETPIEIILPLLHDSVVINSIKERHAWCNRNAKLFGISKSDRLLEDRAAAMGLNPDKLRAIGVTDNMLRTETLIHETNHIRGQAAADWTDKSYLDNEAHVYALDEARLGQNSAPFSRQAIAFGINYFLLYNLFYDLRQGSASFYGQTASAIALTRARLRSQPDIWDQKQDCFRADFYKTLEHSFGPGDSKEKSGNLTFQWARKILIETLDNHGFKDEDRIIKNVAFVLTLRDAALQAEQALKQEGHALLKQGERDYLPFQTALILRQFARAADDVMQYADAYYPPAPAAKTMPKAAIV